MFLIMIMFSLAGSGVAEAEPTGNPALQTALTQLTHADMGVRQNALATLRQLRNPAAIPALMKAMTDTNLGIRVMAVQALGQIGDPIVITALIKAANDDPAMRPAIIVALHYLTPSLTDIPAIIQAEAHGKEDPQRRKIVTWMIGNIKDPAVISVLTRELARGDPAVRQTAVQALGHCPDPARIPVLIQALEDKDPGVREAVGEALGGINDPRAVAALEKLLGDSEVAVRLRVVQTLNQFKNTTAVLHVLPLLKTALKDPEERVRASAHMALKVLGELDSDLLKNRTGWIELPNTNGPVPRQREVLIYDPKGHRLVLFGGWNGLPLGDTWLYDLTTSTWTQINTGGPTPRTEAMAVYDRKEHRLILFGGRGWDVDKRGSSMFADTWSFNFTTLAWKRLKTTPEHPLTQQWVRNDERPVEAPEPRGLHTMIYDERGHRVIIFGGVTFGQDAQGVSGHMLDDTWSLDLATLTWQKILSDETPLARCGAPGIYDPINHRLVIVGGTIDDKFPFTEPWILDLTAHQWKRTKMHGELSFPPRGILSTAYDRDRSRLIFFGGEVERPGDYQFSDTVGLNLKNLSFDLLLPVDPQKHEWLEGVYAVVYDEQRQRLIAFGGKGRYANRLLALPLIGTAELYRGVRVEVAGLKNPLAPFAGALVTVTSAQGVELASSPTDDDGVWEATLPEGTFEVRVTKADYPPHREQVKIAKSGMVRLSVLLDDLKGGAPLLKPRAPSR